MKKILIVLSLAVLTTAFRPIPPPTSTLPPVPPTAGVVLNSPSSERGGGWGVVLAQPLSPGVVFPDCCTFTVDNGSSDSIGNVRISGASSYADFNVVTTASYQQSVCFTAMSVTVNGVAVTYPNSGNVQLASGVWVKVGWQSTSFIEIADERGTNSPVRQ